MVQQISVFDLKEKLDSKQNFILVDCREDDEFNYCRIDGAVLIPISRFEEEVSHHLGQDDEIVIYCHHGMRSMQACLFLESLGYQNTKNVSGGIEAWSLHIDSKVLRY